MPYRKDYRDLTEPERDLYVAALHHLKSTGVIDTFADIHVDNFGVAHGGSSFPPWHREFLRLFEGELRAYDPSISIPFWNWMVDRATNSLLWSSNFLGQFDSDWGLGRDLGSGTLPTSDMVDTALDITPYSSFRPELEVTIHNPPHPWVALPSSSGGVMASAASPGDPVFYLHHCFIDMLWAQWQVRNPTEPFQPDGGAGGEDLTEAMAPWLTTPGDVLDHRKFNSYDYPPGYERDPPKKETSDRMSRIASKALRGANLTKAEIKALGGSVLSQDETKGKRTRPSTYSGSTMAKTPKKETSDRMSRIGSKALRGANLTRS